MLLAVSICVTDVAWRYVYLTVFSGHWKIDNKIMLRIVSFYKTLLFAFLKYETLGLVLISALNMLNKTLTKKLIPIKSRVKSTYRKG